MSEPIPESIPTSSHRNGPPRKKPRFLPPSASASASQANEIESLLYTTSDGAIPLSLPESSAVQTASLAAPPEIVANVQGSSAGAGSGEFHVYKASRRRENERLRAMEEEDAKEKGDAEWEGSERRRREADEERTRRNREKRNKKKKGKGGQKATDAQDGLDGPKEKKELKVREVRRGNEDDAAAPSANGTLVGVAQVVRENALTIHDDD